MRGTYPCGSNVGVRLRLLILCSAVTVVASGCGRAGPDIEVEPVGGVVLFNGEPVEGATVSFTPDRKGRTGTAVPAVGRTGPDGSFQLRALQSGRPVAAGTAVGQYIVTVTKQDTPAMTNPEFANNPPPVIPPAMLEVRDLLPPVYRQLTTTPLRAEVQAGDNQFRFELVTPATGAAAEKKAKHRR